MEKHIGPLIKQLNDKLEKRANNRLRSSGLTMQQMSVLMELDHAQNGQLTFKEIERRLKVSQPTTVGIVDRLKQKNLVNTFVDLKDKRVKWAKITNSGRVCCADSSIAMNETEHHLTAMFTQEELQYLTAYLKRLIDNVED